MTRLIVATALAVCMFGGVAANRVAAADEGAKTEKLLKDAKFDFKKVKDGVYKVVVETKKGVVIVIVEEKEVGKDQKGNPLLSAWIYTEVLQTPADFKPPVAMLTKLAEMNDTIKWGSVGFSKNKDGSYTMYRNSHVFLKNLDAQEFVDHVFIATDDKFALSKLFAGFLEG